MIRQARQHVAVADDSGPARERRRDERFDVVTSIRGFPLGVRDRMQTLFGGQLDIAESKAEIQGIDATVTPKRPLRRLVAAACSIDHCLVYYERGGSDHGWIVALFHWTPAETRVEWAGQARGGLVSIDDVRKAVLAGTIKGPVTSW